MKLIELIGKRAIRTAPIKQQVLVNEFIGRALRTVDDEKFCEHSVTVLSATETHAIVLENDKEIVIAPKYCDDNWEDFDIIEKAAEETRKSLGLNETNEKEE